MKTQLRAILGITSVMILLSGCASLEKMQKGAAGIRYKVTPEILETHGGRVDVAINGILPGQFFDKKARVAVTPVLQYAGGETVLPLITLQGEKVKDNNKAISYNAGGNFSYKQTFPYKEEMRKSELVIRMQATKGKQQVDFKPVPIARGILATHTLMAVNPKVITGIVREANLTGKYDPAIDAFQRIVPDEMIADIYYLINSATLRTEEANADDVKQFLDYTKDAHYDNNKQLKKVEVSAYASPDGTLDLNTELASRREKVSTAFVEEEMKKAKVEANLRTRYTPEDWEGFKEMLEKSDIQDKDLILRVLSMYTDPEVREREIKNLSSAFTQVADIVLPKLRRAKLLTSVNIIGKTDDEIIAIATSRPESLNQAELLHAASLTDDSDQKMKIYTSFSKIFPDDWRGPNNAGMVLASAMKYAEAKPYFEKAEKLKPEEPIIKNNLGTIAFFENDIRKAEEYFGAASGSGNEVNYNLGLVNIRRGDYNRANQYFRSYADPNTALVKILSGNYNGALSDLEDFEKPDCYLKEYLKAIVAVRTGKEELFMESLKKAVVLNPGMKAKAATEMEFAKYFENPKFREIVK